MVQNYLKPTTPLVPEGFGNMDGAIVGNRMVEITKPNRNR